MSGKKLSETFLAASSAEPEIAQTEGCALYGSGETIENAPACLPIPL